MEYIEQWRTAVYDGETYERFQVSNLGRVMNLNYRGTGKAKLVEPFDTSNGYLQVNLSKNKETKKCYVHRLVTETFIPNPENKPEVNHKDEDKTNNSVENLEWILHKDNCNHGTRNERVAKANTNGIRSKPVLQFTLDGEFVREYPSVNECGRNGFNQGNISLCCSGKRKSAYGFKWCYA